MILPSCPQGQHPLEIRRVTLAGDWLVSTMSSANIRMFVPEEKERDAKSLIYVRNSRGPRIEPWGTPDLTESQG